MTQRLTNQMLNDLLQQLGFKPAEATEKKHRVWQHPESGCTLLLPVNKIQQAARPTDVAGIRAQLDLHGHLDQEGFDVFAAEGNLPTR